MAIYDETVKKYKQYLKDAQIEALMEQSRQYNRENAGNRAAAVSQARSDYDTAYRGLQNMGLAGAKGTEITGEVPRLKTNIAGEFNRVNAQLYNREQQAVEALGGQYAAQTKAQQAAEAAARASAASQVESEEAAKRNAVGGLVTGAVSAALAGQTKPNANTATLIPSKGQRIGMETAAKARGTGGMVTGATAAAIAQQEFEQKKALAAMQALGIRRSKFASIPTQKTAAKTTVNALQSSQAAQQEYLSAMEMLRRAQAGAQKDPRAGSGVAYYADKVGEILSNPTIPTEQRVQMSMEYLQADVDERTSPLADRKAKEIIARAYGMKVPKSDETFDALDKARRSKTGGMGYGVGATYDQDAEIAFRQEQSNRAEYNYYMPAIANKIRYAGKTGKVNDKETDFVYNVINGKITEETLKKMYGRSDPGTKYRYLLLDEEEKNAYNYLYEKKGLKAANDYADSLMPLLEMRGAEEDQAAWEEYTKEHPVAANIHSIGLSAAEIAPAISRVVIGAYNEISGTKNPAYVDTNSTLYSGTNRRTTIRTKTSGMILGDNPTGWQKVKNFAYNTGMSMADSATMLPFAYAGLPWVSDLVFFSSASNEAYKDAISRGANQADAILAGAASGIAEALFEHVSLDKVVKMSTSGKGKFIMNILKQAGIEASEEACTSIANLITDKLFLGELSNNELDRKNYIQEYMATGMSREEAEKKANIQVFTDTIKDIGMDALGGFASGLGFGLFGAATNAYTQKQIGKEVKQNSEVLDNDYRVAELLGGETADLARKYDQRSITEMEAGDLHTAIVSKLQEQAEVSEKNAETVAAVLDGREISADQAADMLQSSKDFLQEAGYDTSSAEALAASYNQRVEEVATAQKEAFDNRARDYNIKRAEEVYTDKEALRNVPLTLPTGVSPVQFAEAERSNFKSRTTIQSDGVELQLSLMDMDGRFTNEQKLERARKAMTAQAQRKLDMIGKISKALGMDVVVHDYMRGSNGYFGEDGKIHFVLSGHMSVARVAAHELTHQMQSVASEKYTVVRDQLIEDVGQDRFDRLLKRKAAQYGYNMESEQGRLACDEEVIAELCEGMLSDKDRLERFAERHTDTALTLKERLTKILNAIHATLKDTFGQNQNRISDMITDEKTADKWLDGLDEVLKKVQEKQQTKEFSDAGTKFSIREEAPPVKTGIAYKVFFVKDGKLYPPMVANPGGADTLIGVWLNADVGAAAPDSKTGRQQVKAGGKGTQGGSGSLAFRPGWHLGDIPRASQFDRLNQATGKKELFPENFVWAECEYAKDVDYQKEAMSYGYTENGKYRHSYAGLPRIPKDGYYRYRTNPNPETVPWVITGAMKVNRLLSDAEVNSILEKNGVAPVHRQGGDVSLEDLGFANVQAQQNVAKFALEIVDGKKIAWVENSGLSRKDLQNYKKVAEYIGEHIGEAYTIIESGSKVYIGEDLPGEYTQSEYTRRLLAKNRAALFAKKKAVDVFGDMIEIATNRRWEKTKHTHNKDAKYGMYRYDTCFAFPVKNNAGKVVDVKAYDAELLIRNASNGKKYLYDIVNIKENTDYQPELQQRKSRKGGAMLPADSGVSSDTMTQNGESVKGKFSLDEEYRKAVSSGNVQEQQKLVEQAAKEAGYTKLFYHGSKKGGGFTTFKNWQYFTENKQYAQRYAGGENGLYTTYVKMENTFDTRQAEARSLFNEARQELGLSKLQENNLPDWTDGYDLSEYIEENDLPYDSIILDEGGDMVNGKPVSRGLSYVIRNPEQIKLADAVTYDDAGNAIPLSERFNMGKKDIRYSLDTEQLEKTVRAIDTKALEEGLQSMTLTSNVNSFTMKDPSRFFDAISKNNTELRDELHDIFEKPHSEATGKYARGIKDMQERVRNIATEAGILSKDGKKFDKAASAAVQNYGEGYQLKKCTVEAKVVDADTVFINAVSDGINVLSGDFTLQEVRKNFGRENGDMIWEKAFDQAQKNSERGQKASAIEYESTTSPYKLTDLQTQFPRTWQKLVEADKAFREMYDEYIGNMNAMLREIYPNSFTKEDDTVAKIDDLVEKKKHRITDTEKAIAERMKSLGKVEAEMAAKKRTDTKAYDTLRRRQTALNEAIADLNEKKAGYNEDIAALAVKKNAIFELDKSGESLNRMHQLEYRQDYYHHFNEMSVGLKEAWNLILQGSNRDISPAVVGNTANSKAKTRWAGFFQQRKGGAYTADAVNGMLKYGALAEYKLAFDPLVAYLRDAEKKIRDVSDETNRNSLILYLNSWTNQIAGKSSDFDRLLTDRGVVGRNILNFLQKLNGRVIRNTLYFNARSAIVQISNISNAVSLVTNPKDWKNGVLCWSRAAKGDEMMQNIMSQSNFLASRFAGVEMMDTSVMAKAEKFANWMLSIADTISAKATWWAAYNQYVRNPNSKSIMSMPRKYESAVDYADDVTRRTHGGRGVGEKAPIMTSKLVSFFAPFQLEVNNTYQLLKENIKKKNALGIATMEATVFAMNAVFEAIVGSTILPFDFIRALIDILFGAKDILDDDDDDHKLASTFKLIGQRIGAETVSGLPYAGMIPQFLGEDTTEAVFGETDMTKYGNVNMGVGGAVGIGKVLAFLAKWGAEGVKPDLFSMVNELSEVLPPIGGKQIARTIGGIAAVAQGYSGKTNSKGEDTVQFATDTNVLNYLHAGIFGKWALTEASEYFGEDRILPKLFGYYNGESASAGSPVKAEEFHAARALGLSGKGYFTIRKELKEYRTQEGKRSSLYTTNLTPAQKAGMDALLISTKGTSSEAKSEGAIVYGRTKQEDGSWGEWKVKADYSSEDLFKLSLYGDTKYSAGTTAMKNGAGIKNVLGLLDTVDAYNDANENPMTATQKRDWLRENVKDTKQAALLDAYILSKNKSTNVKVEGNVVYTMSLGEDGKPSVTKDGTVAEWKVKADYTDDTWYAISRHGDSKYRKGLTAVRKGANPKTIRKYLDDMQAYQDSKNQSMSSEERRQWIRRNGGTPKEQAILDAYMLRKDSNTDAKVKDGIVYTLELGEDGKPRVYKSGSVAEWKVKADYTSDEWYAVSQTDHYDKAKTAYSACGIKPTVFVDFYTRWSDLSAKDASGKTVSGLKKKRTKELLDKMKISTEQKAYLYYKVCGYK